MNLPDVQSQPDLRQIPIPAVGIAPVEVPIRFGDGRAPAAASVGLFTDLAPDVKGTHMSRMVELIMAWRREPVTAATLFALLDETRGRLGARTARVSVAFRHFVEKEAPVTGKAALVPYDVELLAGVEDDERQLGWRLGAVVTTLCPCSEAISDYGAHNQRGTLSVATAFRDTRELPLVDGFLEQLEQLGSCPLYTLLKRPDEKWVTEAAYRTPKFVEDVLRDAVLWLQAQPEIGWFAVKVSNDESIHPHNAVAYYDRALVDPQWTRPALFWWDHRL